MHWAGPVPSKDDFGHLITETFIDGKTKVGPWAIMTPESHAAIGMGLGLGKGQQYTRQEDGRWLKTAG